MIIFPTCIKSIYSDGACVAGATDQHMVPFVICIVPASVICRLNIHNTT